MKLRSELWGLSFLSLLGFVPLACAGKSVEDPEGGGGTAAGNGQGSVTGRGGGVVPGTGGAVTGGAGGPTTVGGGAGTAKCINPQLNPDDGIVRCNNRGAIRQSVGQGCPYAPPAAGGQGSGGESAGEGGAASYAGSDAGGSTECDPAQCTAKPRGYCDHEDFDEELAFCRYGCLTDADCGSSQVCMCSDPTIGGVCIDANCQTDADCDPGRHCGLVSGTCGGGMFLCESSLDECTTDADCAEGYCARSGDRRICDTAICGRPFMVDDRPRVAALTQRADWRDQQREAPDTSGLSEAERDLLAGHWARLGQLEQASIAAFARFALQLLALGAPAELVVSCGNALQDETAHATLCFELASRYAGRSIGPAELAVADCLGAEGLGDVLELVIAEGCIGETMAAMEAAEAALCASDPAVRAALARISADETRHAELAWRFARWAIERGGPELHAVARRTFARYQPSATADGATNNDRLRAHGLLSSDELSELHAHALRDVIRPCAQALFDGVPAAPTVGRAPMTGVSPASCVSSCERS